MKNKLKKFYGQNKKKLLIILIVFLAGCLIFQIHLFYNEKITEKDLVLNYVGWSEYCEGDNYTEEEKQDFCNQCLKSGNCTWPLDLNFTIGKVKRTINSNGEIHCYLVVDSINYYTEKGSYFGITEESLFTWSLEDASKKHEVEFCCGITRKTLFDIFGLEKKWPQACVKKNVEPRCSGI